MRNFFAALLLCALLPLCAQADPLPTSKGATTVTSAARASRPVSGQINLNTADAETLAREMDGIGAAKARAIIEHRQRNGAFKSVDELALVKGIGRKTIEANRSRLTIGAGGAPRQAARTEVPRTTGR